jgi:transposase-like protein
VDTNSQTPSSYSRWQTKFATFVRRYGTARLARDLEVDPAAVYQWVRGATSPRLTSARRIMALSHELSLEDIYQQREAAQPEAEMARAATC